MEMHCVTQPTENDFASGCLSLIGLGIGGLFLIWIGGSIWEGVHENTQASTWKCWNTDLHQWRIVRYERPFYPPSNLESKYIRCEVSNN
jgi:hypothetical protein